MWVCFRLWVGFGEGVPWLSHSGTNDQLNRALLQVEGRSAGSVWQKLAPPLTVSFLHLHTVTSALCSVGQSKSHGQAQSP